MNPVEIKQNLREQGRLAYYVSQVSCDFPSQTSLQPIREESHHTNGSAPHGLVSLGAGTTALCSFIAPKGDSDIDPFWKTNVLSELELPKILICL